MRRRFAKKFVVVTLLFIGFLFGFMLRTVEYPTNSPIQQNILDLEKLLGQAEHLTGSGRKQLLPILVLACNRPTVTRCLDKLLKYRPSPSRYPIILSQDCRHSETTDSLKLYEPHLAAHIFQPDSSSLDGYSQIARHYGWALNYVFNTLNFSSLVILEDDLDVALDFFEYFTATLPLLQKDTTLYCVSAWNDNGMTNRINLNAPDLLYRTDFFPGLGWMLTKKLWQEIGSGWPKQNWDAWIRKSAQRKGRACIRPEISRTYTFGKIGVSRGTFFESHLKHIELNNKFVNFTSLNLSYLIKENYNKIFLPRVHSAKLISSISEFKSFVQEFEMEKNSSIRHVVNKTPEFRIEYRDETQFIEYARELNIMERFWDGVPRTGYFGMVSTMVSNHRLYLTPTDIWKRQN